MRKGDVRHEISIRIMRALAVTLTPGARLGSYQVTASLGAGGMGEVYRATDTALGHSVAIKVLPESLALDSDRLARCEREARTLASLNHPNIARSTASRMPALRQAQGKRRGCSSWSWSKARRLPIASPKGRPSC
jgi:serine/threonine protein kinase